MRSHGPELTSIRAARVAAARRLGKRAFRVRSRCFLAEGPQAITEALAGPNVVVEVFATRHGLDRYGDVVERAEAAEVPVHLVSGEVFAALAQTVTPQGLVAVCRFVDVALDEVLSADPKLIAVLAQVRDPGNAGTVLRCADAAGADAVVITGGSVDVYNAKCVRATAGSLFHLPVTIQARADECVAALRERGMTVLAADGAGPVELDDAVDASMLSGPTAWLLGNEAWGLPEKTRRLADVVVRVPVYGRAESLNLATAAAVCLYASARSQRAIGGCRSGQTEPAAR